LGVVYAFESRTGGLDRKLLEWSHTQGKRYSDPERAWMEGVSSFLKSTEEELKKVATHLRESTGPQFVPLQTAIYASTAVPHLHEHDQNFAVAVLDILTHLGMFNEYREHWVYYFQLTFTAVGVNHDMAVDNVDTAEANMSHRPRIIVDKISKLEDQFK
jgi:hypothetical protein